MTSPGSERIAALVADCTTASVSRQVLLFRTDRLPGALSRPHHHRLAEAALAPLMACPRAELFRLPGPRLAVAWRGEAEDQLLDVVDALEHLMADASVPTPSLRDLVSLYDLPESGDLLLDALADEFAAPLAPQHPPLEPANLMLLEATLAQADLARFARRETIWHLDPPSPAWERRTLCLEELGAELLPGRDLAGDPWLLRRLERTLDRRLLALLASPGELAAAGPFVLGLQVASMLSPDFLRFDAALPPMLRGRVMIAFSPVDAFNDAAAFAFARGFARAREYRVMLRDASPDLLAALSPTGIEVDHVQLGWTPELPEQAAALLDSWPAASLILGCGVSSEALAWARSNGIPLVTTEMPGALAAA